MPHFRAAVAFLFLVPFAPAQQKPETVDLTGVAKLSPNAARVVTVWFDQDRGALGRAYPVPSPTRDARMAKYYADWSAALAAADVSRATPESKKELTDLAKK